MSKRRSKTFRLRGDRRRANYSPLLEVVESRVLLAVFTVTSAADNGLGTTPGSLSWAITQVNSDPKQEVDTIDFNIQGAGPFTIAPLSALPDLSHPAFIDGESQPGYAGAPIIQIQGPGKNSVGDGLTLAAGSGGSFIGGLSIGGFAGGAGIHIESDGNLIFGNFLGTDITGETSQSDQYGVEIDNASNNTIGGSDGTNSVGAVVLSDGNLVSGNTDSGVWLTGLSSNNSLEGNFLGTDGSGKVKLPNGSGVLIDAGAERNIIGGFNELNDADRITLLNGNLISGNTGSGVDIEGEGTSFNAIEGDYIGLDGSFSNSLGNVNGVTIQEGAASNTIGGLSAETRNVISASTQAGIAIEGKNTSWNTVVGNYIGTDYSGTIARGNSNGVVLSNGAQFNSIGATGFLPLGGTDLPANLISANTNSGIDIEGATTMHNAVEGNFIGTDQTGTRPLPNEFGVQIGTGASANTIGGSTTAGNLISGNLGDGVLITGSPSIDFADGFGSNGGLLSLNGNAKYVSNQLQLTDGGYYEARSAFSNSRLDVSDFSTEFQFQISPGESTADGLTFCIQAVGPTALGGPGGSLGYAGISNSVAVKFDLYNNAGEGPDSTGIYTNGATPFVPAIDLSNTGINLHSGDPFDVTMSYNGTTLNVTITDTVTKASASQSYTVNIPSIVGGSYAYVGFTGGTGGLTSVQSILNWTFTPIPSGTSFDNVVAGNLIGTDYTGTNPLGNGTGVLITGGAERNTVGGTSAGSANILSGNRQSGVDIESIGSSDNSVEGNYIGTNLDANNSLNTISGMAIQPTGVLIGTGASQNTVGPGNIISGNENNGVLIQGFSGATDTSDNTIEGNLIGTVIGPDTEYAFGPGDNVGVLVDDGATANTIGTGNVIGCNPTAGIEISGTVSGPQTSRNVVAGDFIGTDPAGFMFLANEIGVLIDTGATANTIGGSVDQRNIISQNLRDGVDIRGSQYAGETSGNTVAGNYIGTDASGLHVLTPPGPDGKRGGVYNPIGVLIEAGASNNTIGGLNELSPSGTPQLSKGNLISGNVTAGIEVSGTGSNNPTTGNLIEGNFIGTDLHGESTTDSFETNYPMGNGTGVLLVAGASSTTIGGTSPAARNLISGNLVSGIEINGGGSFVGVTRNFVEGNYIGTDLLGMKSLMNVIGVLIDSGAYGNTVGGSNLTDPGTRAELNSGNLISGNTTGVDISGASSDQVEGNLIGTDPSGTSSVPNGIGVTIEGVSIDNTIGGSTSGARNVISGNSSAGVVMNGSNVMYNCIEGNYVGANINGALAVPDENVPLAVPNGIGILIVAGASCNTVGGMTDTAQTCRNIISGNTSAGLEILGFLSSEAQASASVSGNCIEGNYIGTDLAGTSAVGNNVGVLLSNAPNNTIGGYEMGCGNVISGNNSIGVQIIGAGSTNEQLTGNFIGPDATGNDALPAAAISNPMNAVQQTGILIDGSIGNDIGESGAPMNVISGNVVGIEFTGIIATTSAPPNTVACNYIGIGNDENILGNVIGVWVNNVSYTQIGQAGAPNYIAGNSGEGVYINGSDATANLVQCNYIGMGPNGQTYNQGNGKSATNPFPIGVYIENSSSNTIGGAGMGNTITGNNVGVYIFSTGGSATSNQIQSNYIGLSLNGGPGPGNVLYGVMLYNSPYNNAPQSGPVANQFSRNGIANFREFSGPVPSTQTSSTSKGSGKTAKKPAHHSNHVAHQSPRRTAVHAVTVHGRQVPAGPIRASSR